MTNNMFHTNLYHKLSNIKGLINEQYMDFRQNIKIYQPQIPKSQIFSPNPKSQIILPPKSQIPNFLTPQIPNTITPPPPHRNITHVLARRQGLSRSFFPTVIKAWNSLPVKIIFFSNSKINILFILTFLVVIFAQRPRRRLTLTQI